MLTEKRQNIVTICIILTLFILTGCIPQSIVLPRDSYMVKGRNYTFAIYNKENKLLTYPIHELLSRVASDQPDITYIYVISHGWDYTITESIAHYHLYINLIDEFLEGPQSSSNFHPYFIFVNWVSVARPTTELVRAILPYGIDKGLTLATKVLDNVAFYLPTAWNQSLNAAINALGTSDDVGMDAYDYEPYALGSFDETKVGRDVPMASVLYKIFKLNHERKLGSGKHVKIHAIGHSFGAKLISIAAMEAIKNANHLSTAEMKAIESAKAQPQLTSNHLESLVLINPAMSPGELTDPFDNIGDYLRSIPRKGIIYSNFDYPNGGLFDFSQMILSNRYSTLGYRALKRQTHMAHLPKGLADYDRYWNRPIAGSLALAETIILSPVSWAVQKIVDLPFDFVYHLKNDQVFRGLRDEMPWLYNTLATVHFFVPLEIFVPGRYHDADQFGILSLTQPALGRMGLNKYLRNRLWFSNGLRELRGFLDETTDQDQSAFCSLARNVYVDNGNNINIALLHNRIYSFDATKVYDSWWPPLVGAHSDLSTDSKAKCGDIELMKRNFTFNFLYNFTKMLPVVSD